MLGFLSFTKYKQRRAQRNLNDPLIPKMTDFYRENSCLIVLYPFMFMLNIRDV